MDEKMDSKKWIHNRAIKLFMVIMYLIVVSVINAFSLSMRLIDPKRNVSTIIESFWFNKERLMFTNFKKRIFL